jgi:hypothetical protein
MSKQAYVSLLQRLSTYTLIIVAGTLLAIGWVVTALAQADGDGDGFDGDELGLPIVLGVGVLAYLGWTAYRRRSPKRQG